MEYLPLTALCVTDELSDVWTFGLMEEHFRLRFTDGFSTRMEHRLQPKRKDELSTLAGVNSTEFLSRGFLLRFSVSDRELQGSMTAGEYRSGKKVNSLNLPCHFL